MNNIFEKGLRFLRRQHQVMQDWFKYKKEIHLINNGEVYVLFSHNADGGGGAPVVLLELAKILKSKNSNVVLLTRKGGNLVQLSRDLGIYTYRIGFLHKKYMKSLSKLNVKMILVNTIVCYQYIYELKNYLVLERPIIWWIHEEDRLLKKYEPYIFAESDENVHIVCVSERIKKTFSAIRPNILCSVMHYGCYDQLKDYKYDFQNKDYKNSEKNFKISVIGRICERKNQIQVVEAYKLLPDKINKYIEIDLVAASWDEDYKNKLLTVIANDANIKIVGPIPREKMYKVYLESDLIICSSIDDPLPVVITEAMMFGCLFITSSCTGQASLINNGINGFVYNVEDINELKSIIEYCYKERNNDELRKNARKLFENEFSLEHLSQQIQNWIE